VPASHCGLTGDCPQHLLHTLADIRDCQRSPADGIQTLMEMLGSNRSLQEHVKGLGDGKVKHYGITAMYCTVLYCTVPYCTVSGITVLYFGMSH
jgi:hypothetical protein